MMTRETGLPGIGHGEVGTVRNETRTVRHDPVTGRLITQITDGPCFDYPMYYYLPTLTRSGRGLLFYRYEGNEVQNRLLDLDTGVSTCLTRARTPDCLWRPWQYPPATGVRDLMSALNPVSDALVYWDRNELHEVNPFTLRDQCLALLPGDRVPCSLTGVSADGRYYCFAHAARSDWDAHRAKGFPRQGCATTLAVASLATGGITDIIQVGHWITHANFHGEDTILFCHAAGENAILVTDLSGGWYTHLRAMRDGMSTCHYQSSRRGILYEVQTPGPTGRLGYVDPRSHRCREFESSEPVDHIGYDPEGAFFFHSGAGIRYFPELKACGINASVALTGPIRTYSFGQRSHPHPALTPDRAHILFTGRDARTETNHLCLLDIHDLGGARTLVEDDVPAGESFFLKES